MRLTEIYSAKAIAIQQTEAAGNRQAYFGEGLFPPRKKMGLDLKWIKTHKGLPVSLAPSNFDAKSTLRSREGIKMDETQMAFFRESMLVKEEDEQNIMRVREASDPYALEVLNHVYDDTNTLVEGARVVAERMRMQLLAPVDDGSPRINIEANGVQYSYNYDAGGTYQSGHYRALTGTAQWSDLANSDPLSDVMSAQDAVEAETGTRPSMLLLSKKTMGYLKKNVKVRYAILAQNVTANVLVTDARVTELFSTELGIRLVVYTKKYKDETGTTHQFYPDDMVTLLPDGALGSTWYGTTPEERTLLGSGKADVGIVDTGIAVAVSVTIDPVNTKTTVSEIVLPSYERMDETFVIKVAGDTSTAALSDVPNEQDDLDSMTKDELLAYANAHNISGVSASMNKADILSAIKAAS